MKHKDPIKKLYIFLAVMLLLLALWIVYVYATNKIPQTRHILAVKPYTADITLDYTLESPYACNKDIKKDLDRLFKAGGYIYSECDLRAGIGAQTNFTLRKIMVDTAYTTRHHAYTFFLAHELTHLKYFTANECFTEYTAIITLYESGNEYFRNVALWRAHLTLQANSQDEYDCGYYLLEYFKREKTTDVGGLAE